MAARAGMAELITALRRESHAGVADYTIAGETYWTDDQLQEKLDQTREDFFEIGLQTVGERQSGSNITYTKYYMPDQARHIERAGTGSLFRLYDSNGDDVSASAYTVNYDAGLITFNSDTENTTFYLDFSAFDLWWAAADVWDAKASQVAVSSIDWSSDNHRVSNKQLATNYQDMAKKCRLKSPRSVRNVRRVRIDEVRS